jgi:hypothetical protein
LKVDFDRREAKIGQAIACRVGVERVGFAGYGMMIAEVGLPPGVEVDRESLEDTKQNGVDGYEVQPDRVVFTSGRAREEASSSLSSALVLASTR